MTWRRQDRDEWGTFPPMPFWWKVWVIFGVLAWTALLIGGAAWLWKAVMT